MSLNLSISTSEPSASSLWRAIAIALASAALLVAVCGLINWYVDPFDRLGRNWLGLYSSVERDTKPKMIRTYPHDGFMIGTSRVTYIEPTLIKSYRLFNAAFSQALPEEMLNFLKVFAVNEKLIVIGLDFMTFNEREYPMKMDTFLHLQEEARPTLTEQLQRDRDYLLSWNVFVSSLRTAGMNMFTKREPPFIQPSGARNFERALRLFSAPVIDYSDTIEYWRVHTLFQFQYSEARLDVLRSIRDLLEQRAIPYIVFINPENVRLMDLIKEMGLYEQNLRFRRDVLSIFPQSVDLSESRWANVEFYLQKEPGHYLPDVGAQMVNDMIAARPDLAR